MNTPIHLRDRAWKRFASLSVAVLLAHTASAATLTFNSNADYDNNFYEVANPGDLGTNVSGYLNKVNTSATSAVYNTHATGGSGGAGGTTFGTPLDTFGDVKLQATFAHSTNSLDGSTGVGFFTKINDAGTSGYLTIFRVLSATTADIRVFDTAALSGVGTTLVTQNITGGTFAKDTYYIAKLTVTDEGANVKFDASLWTAADTLISGSSVTITDTTTAVTGLGQVGLRAGSGASSSLRIDSFSVTAVPEPSTYALFASGGALCVALLRRKRTQR